LTLHRTVVGVVLTIAVLAAPSVVAQQPSAASSYEAEPSVLQAPCCRFVNFYLWPSEPQHYRCCSGLPDQVVSPALGGPAPGAVPPTYDRVVVTPNASNPRIVRRSSEPICVNLSQLTPIERLLSQTVFGGSCVDFVTYDHFPCSCQTFCNDASWLCNCPGVPAGELPEIKPQDSLGSQPEFLSTTCIPCNTQSTCSSGAPPPGKSPS